MSVKFHEAFSLDSARRRFWFEDHFLGDSLRDLWRGTGTGSVAVVDAQDGGIIRITTGATNLDTYQVDWGTIRSLLVSKKVTFEARVKYASVASINTFIGLYLDGNRFIYFAENGGVWNLITKNAGGSSTTAVPGINLDTDWHIYRIECFPTGEVHFYYDGSEVTNSPITTTIPAEHMAPYFRIQTQTGSAKTMDIDYVAIRQDR